MAGFIVAYGSYIQTPAGYLSSGDDSSFPKANIGIFHKPNRPWKSAANVVSGTTYVGVDLGAAMTLAAVVIDHINLTGIKIQASSTSDFSSDVTTSAALGTAQNELDGRWKRIYFTSGTDLESVSKQYWRILANSNNTVPGGVPGKMRVGSMICLAGYKEWASGVSDYQEIPLEATRPNSEYAGGGDDPVILGNPYEGLVLGAAPFSRALMRSDLLELLRQGLGRYFVFYPNRGVTSEVYVVRRAADVALRTTAQAINTVQFQQWALSGAV